MKSAETKRADDRPWYHEGLRFQCTGCGDCCTGAPGYVWVNDEEIVALAELVELDVDAFERKYVRKVGRRRSLIELPNGDCIFFNSQTRRCTVYLARPRQCQTWPFWQSNLETRQTWAETSRACPGCGQGPLIPLEQIKATAAVVRV
jgi:Fe-S-cluster containining protein